MKSFVSLSDGLGGPASGIFGPPERFVWFLVVVTGIFAAWLIFASGIACAQGGQLPGTDASDKLEAAGTLLRLVDTALFKWGARIFAGICIMSAAWSLKEQRFGIAIICIIGAIVFGTAPSWVRNIFAISGSDSVFGLVAIPFFSKTLLRPQKGIGHV